MSKPRRTYPASSYLQSSPVNQQPIGEAAQPVPLYSPESLLNAPDQSQQSHYQQLQQPGYPQTQYQNSEKALYQQAQQQSYQQQPQQSYQQTQQTYPDQQPQQPIYQYGYPQQIEQRTGVENLTQGVAGLGLSSTNQGNIFNLQSIVPPVNEVLDFCGPKIGLNVI